MIDVTRQNFEIEVIAASHRIPVLVDFWAPWCAPCRTLSPVLERIEHDLAGQMSLVKVNSDDNPEIASALGVRGIPNVILFINGKPVDNFVGALPEERIRAFLARHVQKPGEQPLALAREAMQEKRYGDAAEALSLVLAVNPANQQARTDYVVALARMGKFQQARTAFEPLAGTALADPRLAAIGRLLDAAEASATAGSEADLRAAVQQAPRDSSTRFALAQWLMVQSRWSEALDELLGVVAEDRKFGDDAGRKTMLAIFDLCPDAALVASYRRKLSASLY